MADANIPPRPQPGDWNAAFAALPLEPAPAEAWSRLAARLPAATHARAKPGMPMPRRRRAVVGGLAAAAAIAFALPMAWRLGTPEPMRVQAPVGVAAQPDAPSRAGHPAGGRAAVAVPRAMDASHAVTGAERRLSAATGMSIAAAPTANAVADDNHNDTMRAAGGAREAPVLPASPRAALRGASPPASRGDAVASSRPVAPSQPVAASTDSDAAPPTDDAARLVALREESARLEALVAYARDDRLTSAPAAVLSATLDDRVRLIDTALMQPDLDASDRASLWGERVGALQELASLAGTQRWLAAHGASMDAVARVD